MILRWGLETSLSDFAALHGFPDRDFGPCRALWGVRNGMPVGVLIVHDWNPTAGTVEVSAMSSDGRFPSARAARAVMAFCFDRMGCQAVVAKTDAKNSKVRRWGMALGADEYIIPRLRGRTASEAILILAKETWQASRWAGKHENTIPSRAA